MIKRHFPPWNGWRRCARTYPIEARRWCPTTAITATSNGGKRKEAGTDDAIPCILEPVGNNKALRENWARLIQKIYEVDPLVCPHCKETIRIISFIEDAQVVRNILRHPGLGLVRSRPPPACAHTADRPKIHDLPNIEYAASDYLTHAPHPKTDAYAAPKYSWDEYIQS